MPDNDPAIHQCQRTIQCIVKADTTSNSTFTGTLSDRKPCWQESAVSATEVQ